MKKTGSILKTGARFNLGSRFFFLWPLALLMTVGCSTMATRPVQEMSDTAAALKAAKEVQADVLAPELYRQANEWFLRARREYKFKNFDLAEEYAVKARKFAEQAEFEVMSAGGKRNGIEQIPDASAHSESPYPKYDYPTPVGTPAEYMTNTPSAPSPDKSSPQDKVQVPVPSPNQ